jgi:hypothetical protein
MFGSGRTAKGERSRFLPIVSMPLHQADFSTYLIIHAIAAGLVFTVVPDPLFHCEHDRHYDQRRGGSNQPFDPTVVVCTQSVVPLIILFW